MMVVSLLHCKEFVKRLIDAGFKLNPYDPCVANKMVDGNQMTILCHVDDCKLSHCNPKAINKMIEWLRENYESVFEDGSGEMKVN